MLPKARGQALGTNFAGFSGECSLWGMGCLVFSQQWQEAHTQDGGCSCSRVHARVKIGSGQRIKACYMTEMTPFSRGAISSCATAFLRFALQFISGWRFGLPLPLRLQCPDNSRYGGEQMTKVASDSVIVLTINFHILN